MKPDPYARGRQRPPHAERAFVPEISFSNVDEMERALGLPPAKPKLTSMRAAVLANLLLAAYGGNKGLHYSRDKNHYAQPGIGFYQPPPYGYASVLHAVNDLVQRGLAAERRVKPGSQRPGRSRLELIADLREFDHPWAKLVRRRERLIRLKDGRKILTPYCCTRELREMSRDISEHNQLLELCSVTAEYDGIQLDRGFYTDEQDRTWVAETNYYRSFNRTFDEGGRWYRPWWQNVRSEARQFIHINGEPTVEEDYRTFHPQLICAHAGLDLPFADRDFDFYQIDRNVDRALVKLAVNTMINASNSTESFRSLCCDLQLTYGRSEPGKVARALMGKIASSYPALERYWSTGVGCRLQRVDGDMCANIQRRCRKLAVACLSVHDSFIVPSQHHQLLMQLMDEELDYARRKLRSINLL